MTPVLGVAMLILLVSVIMMPVSESFALMRLNKDSSGRKHHWLVEETFAEEPDFIQTNTRETNLNLDKVSDNKPRWGSEEALEEHPQGIQDKPVSSEYENDD
jgi:hypothetical protein